MSNCNVTANLIAGWGLGRILKSSSSSDAKPAATLLAQNLKSGENAAANSRTPTTRLSTAQPL